MVVPILLFAIGSYAAYRNVRLESKVELTNLVAMAEAQVKEVLDLHRYVGNTVSRRLSTLSSSDIIADERHLHADLADLIVDLPQVKNLWVTDETGHDVLSGTKFPVDHRYSVGDQQHFQLIRDGHLQIFFGNVQSTSDHHFEFTIARARQSNSGQFGGLIATKASSSDFIEYFGTLFRDRPTYSGGIYRDDGAVLARYPAIDPGYLAPGPNDILAPAIARNPEGGVIQGRSAIDGKSRFAIYHKLPDYPVYIVVARKETSIFHQWLQSLFPYAAVGIPASIALFLLSFVALRRVESEQHAVAQAEEAARLREVAEAALRQSQKIESIGLLTAGIAHDFNNMLAAVLGYLDLIPLHLAAGRYADLGRLVTAATRAAERGAKLTSQLLAFARRSHLEIRPFDMTELLSDIGDLLQRTLGPTISIRLRLAQGAWPVSSARDQIEASILNLAINARDAMESGGVLTIETRNVSSGDPTLPPELLDGDYLMISLSDTGTGMTEDVKAKALEPFFTTKAIGKGTGLGLSMVFGISQQSGGTCTIESEVGKGTTVAIYLPRAGDAFPSAVPQQPAMEIAGRTLNVLLVDDDESVRSFIASALDETGHEVTEAHSGDQALAILAAGLDFDLLIVDYAMPEMNGAEVARRARQQRPGLPILMITGFADNTALNLPPDTRMLSKPFRIAELRQEIARVLHTASVPAH
ncbi:MAG TPA: response regulator [Aliidongia sp.]|uniref:hybrid sensor histidine kinase/response regulator n=1 Tax=Aliidongia sp. TaxID=1914230 RepID=UPI002DDD4331|nr:response regulator [Aliidongia sp.]HEV2675349.1 response regulator [Aliidongia sp.]